MKKLQAHTLFYGSAPWMTKCVPTIEAWCNRHGHELVIWDDPTTWASYPSPKFVEVDALRHFLRGDADVFLWIDADVYVNAHAPACPEFEGIAMATCQYHAEHQYHWESWCLENFGEAPIGFQYSNAGVYFIDRAAAEILIEKMVPPFIECFQEQHAFCWWVYQAISSGARFTRLPNTWNRHGRSFEASWFTHFWGDDKDRDIEAMRKANLLDVKPDGLIRNWQPPTWPSSDKVIVLEFVQDAGLGNTLFEISAAYSIARELNLPLRWMWRPSKLRDFGLHHFGIGESPYVEYPMLMLRAGQGNRDLRNKAIRLIKESKERFCGISCPFQDEACFSDHADEIRDLFKPMVQGFPLPHPECTIPVGVQVRRGDYVTHSKLNVTTPEYFLNAMQWMRKNLPSPHFIVVSDDPEFCRRIFMMQGDVTVMPPQTPFDGLRTLANCEAHIISNSTFGWWGAWLGEKGPVIAPEYWHHYPGSYGKWEIVPDRWVKLPIGQEVLRTKPPEIKPRSVTEFPAPGVPRAIVIPWHADQAKWHELRYALRSIEKHFADKKCPIYVFGTRRPGFIREGGRVEYRGAFTYSEALANGVQSADEVLWWNDDCIALKDFTWDDCRVPYYVRKADPEDVVKAPEQTNPWREGCRQVFLKLYKEGNTNLRIYSTHLPYVWQREKALEVFRKFGVYEKIAFELCYFHTFPEGSRQLTNQRTHTLPNDEAMFLNYADWHLTQDFKDEVARRFPDLAAWEVGTPS